MGSSILQRKDYRPGREHLPCPSLMRFLGASLIPSRVPLVGNGKWTLGTLRLKPKTPLPDYKVKLLHDAMQQQCSERIVAEQVKITHVINVLDNRNKRVRKGDNVSLLDDDGCTSYCTLEHILRVDYGGKHYCWIFPVWYELLPECNTSWERHAATIARKPCIEQCGEQPIQLHRVEEQICVVHSCKSRRDSDKYESKCCIKEGSDYHDLEHNEYAVFDGSCGYVRASATKGLTEVMQS